MIEKFNIVGYTCISVDDDPGRVFIPKEIRRTMRIRVGDPSQTMLSPWEQFCVVKMEPEK